MEKKQFEALAPKAGDILRATAYSVLMVWAVLFLVFPPLAYVSTVEVVTRLTWMGITFTGALLATVGSLTRYDLKMELPGLVIAIIGPIFYFAAQVYYVVLPVPGIDVVPRIAFTAYTILPAFLMLPRIHELSSEAEKMKKVHRSSLRKRAMEAVDSGQNTKESK